MPARGLLHKRLPLVRACRRSCPIPAPCCDCHSAGFPPGRPLVCCWRLRSKGSWWLRAQPPTAAPRPRQAMASVPRMAYKPVATAEEVQGDLHVSFETSLPQGAALVGLEIQAVTWHLLLTDRRHLSLSHHMRGHFPSCFDQAFQGHCGQKEDETELGTTSAGESHRGYLKRVGPLTYTSCLRGMFSSSQSVCPMVRQENKLWAPCFISLSLFNHDDLIK